MSQYRFDKVDEGRPEKCIAFLDAAHLMKETQRDKQRTFEMLEIRAGQTLLDVGCGTGIDVCRMASLVGNSGYVVGVDASQAMILEARQRAHALGLPVTFYRASTYALPFEDESFNGCRAERLLHFLDEPEIALREMMRVTTAGGRIVSAEPNWDSLEVSGGNDALTAEILDAGKGGPLAPRSIGSRLYDLFIAVGLVVDQTESVRLEVKDFKTNMEFFALNRLASHAASMGRITVDAAGHWLQQLLEAAQHERLHCALTSYIVAGIKSPNGREA